MLPEKLLEYNFDCIIIVSDAENQIQKQLINMGIQKEKIIGRATLINVLNKGFNTSEKQKEMLNAMQKYEKYFWCGNLMNVIGNAFDQKRNLIILKDLKLSYDIYEKRGYAFIKDCSDILGDYIKENANLHDHYFTEGPYEWEDVRLEEGDTIIDCGANFGIFSSLAAIKTGKKGMVYAFEPVPMTIEILKKTTQLYENIEVCEYGTFHSTGRSEIDITDIVSSNGTKGYGASSMVIDRSIDGNPSKIEINTITIDDFVEKRKIKHIDFIKADIEGAERFMLEGAKRTLKEFAPKLSICTYHLKDDLKVLKEIILKANPKYKIMHKYEKLYAYIPK